MSSIDQGYTRIINPILEALSTTQLSGYQTRILIFIIRKTYGFQKKEDAIALSQFEEGTLLTRQNVCRTIRELLDRKIIIKIDNKFRINKTTSQWRALSKLTTEKKQKTVIKNDNGIIKIDNRDSTIGESPLSKLTHTKEKKETLSKERRITDFRFILKNKDNNNPKVAALASQHAWPGEDWPSFTTRIQAELARLER